MIEDYAEPMITARAESLKAHDDFARGKMKEGLIHLSIAISALLQAERYAKQRAGLPPAGA